MSPRNGHACARLDQNTVAVVGGRVNTNKTDTMELLDLSTGTWSEGPTLPLPLADVIKMVSFEDALILINGQFGEYEETNDSFYKYACSYGFCEWEIMEHELGDYYGKPQAMLIPSAFANCE